jgi:hypothetical protein
VIGSERETESGAGVASITSLTYCGAIFIVPPLLSDGTMSIGRMSSVLFPGFRWLGAILPPRHASAWMAALCLLQGSSPCCSSHGAGPLR